MIDQIVKFDSGIPSAFKALGVGTLFLFTAAFSLPFIAEWGFPILTDFEEIIRMISLGNTYIETIGIALLTYVLGLFCIQSGEELRKIRFDKGYLNRINFIVLKNVNPLILEQYRISVSKAEFFDGLSIAIPLNFLFLGLSISGEFPLFGGFIALAAVFLGNALSRQSCKFFRNLDELIAKTQTQENLDADT